MRHWNRSKPLSSITCNKVVAPAATAELVIYAPGLLGPYAGQEHWQTGDWPDLPLLQQFLSRAERVIKTTPVQSDEASIFEYFNLDTHHTDLPLAALSLLAEGGVPETDCWMRLDPVCLHADRTDAILIAHDEMALTEAEADALQESIRPLLDEWSISLQRTNPHHWYIRFRDHTTLSTTPLSHVKGQAITQHMPMGNEHLKWHRLINEVQMLWHAHPVNQQREQQGQLMATSVWPWGCGVLPEKVDTQLDKVYSDDLLVQGLALLISIPVLPPQALQRSEVQGNQLLIDLSWRDLQQQQDVTGWFAALADWQATVLSVLEAKLQQNKSLQVTFDFGGEHRYRVRHKSLHRWWRRTQSLQQLVVHAA